MATVTDTQRIAALEQQVVNLSLQVAASQGQPGQLRLPTGVNVQPPQAFSGATDGDSVTNFILQLNNYFNLIQLTNDNLRARYAETLLVEQVRNWYAAQQYDFTLVTWTDLVDDLKAVFRPADFAHQARVQLSRTRIASSDIVDYVACFNVAYNHCVDVVPEEA